jgi:7,8-dihydropterin-6-yl-methyl-4-(beta-D-ribofuranosyl)aminobenzene 5'-phosphate synthase
MVERADKLEEKTMQVICVVDDAVQRSSPYWGEHGLAFLIEAEGRRVLFDTGQSGTVLLHNLGVLGVDPQTLVALAISHAHYDHTGGLPTLLEHLRPGTALYTNPDLFRERFSRQEGQVKSIGPSLTREALATRLALKLDARPQEILPGLWTTGEIAERPEAEGKSNYHLMREGEALVADAYRDDMALVFDIGDRLVLLCGCCHAGLLNTLAHVQHTFERPIAMIAGGLHLASATAQDLQHIGQVLTAMPALQRVYPNHCSGEAAFVALTQILGPSVVRPCPVGTFLEF